MHIHQIQVRYDALADRLLMQVRTRDGEVFSVWLTRRMLQRLWQPLQRLTTELPLPRSVAAATLAPEARTMLAESAMQRPLPNADFGQAFGAAGDRPALGPEPLLAAEVELQATPQRGLRMLLREAGGRHFALQLTADLATALWRLLNQALAAADWALAVAAPAGPATPAVPPALN